MRHLTACTCRWGIFEAMDMAAAKGWENVMTLFGHDSPQDFADLVECECLSNLPDASHRSTQLSAQQTAGCVLQIVGAMRKPSGARSGTPTAIRLRTRFRGLKLAT